MRTVPMLTKSWDGSAPFFSSVNRAEKDADESRWYWISYTCVLPPPSDPEASQLHSIPGWGAPSHSLSQL